MNRHHPLFLLFIVIAFVTPSQSWTIDGSDYNDADDNDDAIPPTLLSIKDHVSGEYLNAVDNPFYTQWQKALSFVSNDETATKTTKKYNHWSGIDEENINEFAMENLLLTTKMASSSTDSDELDITIPSPSHLLLTNKKEVRFGESLTLSWIENTKLITNDSLIGLYCPSNAPHDDFREIFTISQAKAMGARRRPRDYHHNDDNDGGESIERKKGGWGLNNVLFWDMIIPRFPIIRESSCQFRLFHQSSSSSHTSSSSSSLTLLHQTPPITLTDALLKPTGIHLSLTTQPTEMLVHFTTGSTGIPIVTYYYYSSITKKQRKIAYGTSDTYTASDMCHPPANISAAGKFTPPGILHTVKMTSLRPDVRYFYKVGIRHSIDDDVVWSEEHSVLSPPSPSSSSSSSSPLSVIIYGDQGAPLSGFDGGYLLTTNLTSREISSHAHDVRMVHVIGDLSYANGASHVWDSWLDMMQPVSTRVPLMVAVGNHEYDYEERDDEDVPPLDVSGETTSYYKNAQSGGECGVPTARRFPGIGASDDDDGSNGVFWYSYDYGLLHTIVFSSEHDLSVGSRQYEWLEKDLKNVNRKRTPWVVLEGHRPMYTPDGKKHAYGGLEYLMKMYSVDLFLSGHVHAYLRLCAGLFDSVCGGDGGGGDRLSSSSYAPTVQIIVGTGGKVIKNNDETKMGPCKLKEVWQMSCYKMYGYGRLTVANATALHWEFVEARKGEVMDDLWLYR